MRMAPFRSAHVLFALVVVLEAHSVGAETPKIVQDAASASVTNLQVLSPGENESSLRWASWMTGSQPGPHAVWLALLLREHKTPRTVWSTSRADGYLPKIDMIFNWQYSGKPTLLFTYQMGAEAQELELYGLDASNNPILIGRASAAAFFPAYRGEFFIDAQGLLNESDACLFFDRTTPKLISKGCPY